MQPDFIAPDFIDNNTAEEIHERMMENLPKDIDDTPGGFAYDFTMPAALEKSEFIEFHLVRALMIAFPEYAWGEWLDLHAKQVNITRHPETHAEGMLLITGEPGTEIAEGTIFCTPATDTNPSIDFATDETYEIGEDGTVSVHVTATEGGTESNVRSDTITMMNEPDDGIISITNPEPMKGGADEETDNDLYDRLSLEYDNSNTYLGNDGDYERWAKEAGAGDCIVVPAANGPGTVKLVLIDVNGNPANDALIKEVYNHIVSPDDREKRLLPTACAELICVSASVVKIDYKCAGILHDETTNIEKIKEDFNKAVMNIYSKAKNEGVLRYNDIRPVLSSITGVEDFEEFFVNGTTENIHLEKEVYPETGTIDFS